MASETLSKGDRTRNSIVDAAYALMTGQGYAATSMRQIAERAGLALGSIYNHFSSKEEVFRAIVEDRHPFYQIVPILQTVQGNTVEDYVRKAAHTLVSELGHYPEFLNLMLTEIVEFRGSHVPLVFGKMFPLMLPVAERLTGLEGNVREIPPPVLLRAFLGMFFSYYITEILVGRAFPPEMMANALDHFVDIFLHGVLIKESE